MRLAWLLFVALAGAPATAQQPEEIRLDVRYAIFRPAEAVITAITDGPRYTVSGLVESAGILGALRQFAFDLRSSGQIDGSAWRPEHFEGQIDTGRRALSVAMHYDAGTPVIDGIIPAPEPSPWSIQATDQSGTLDPLSIAYRALRTQPTTDLCNWTADIFDGHRRARVTISPAAINDRTAVCAGTYTRTGGYSPRELSRYTDLNFVLFYETQDEEFWRITSIDAETAYGTMHLIRED